MQPVASFFVLLADYDFSLGLADLARDVAAAIFRLNMILISDSPDPDFTSAWFRSEYAAMRKVALMFIVVLALAAAINAVIKGGMKSLMSTFVIGIPVAVFGGSVAIALLAMAVAINNEMTQAISGHGSAQMDAFYRVLQGDIAGSIPRGDDGTISVGQTHAGSVSFLVFLLFLLAILASLFLWIELMVRQVMLYIAVLFFPLAFAAYVWPPLRAWLYSIIEICIAMVFSKFIVAAVATFGFLAIFQSAVGPSAENMIGLLVGGVATVSVAAFSLPALLSFVMRPNFQVLGRKEVGSKTPWSAGRSGAAGAAGTSAGKFAYGKAKSMLNKYKK